MSHDSDLEVQHDVGTNHAIAEAQASTTQKATA